jgi:hypothetical protein
MVRFELVWAVGICFLLAWSTACHRACSCQTKNTSPDGPAMVTGSGVNPSDLGFALPRSTSWRGAVVLFRRKDSNQLVTIPLISGANWTVEQLLHESVVFANWDAVAQEFSQSKRDIFICSHDYPEANLKGIPVQEVMERAKKGQWVPKQEP